MSDEQKIFKFDLNESLYFEKGQEIEEMITVSLDPIISIQSFEDYVSIRGVIELQGEYNIAEESEELDLEGIDEEDQLPLRTVNQVELLEDGKATFNHRFPVDISVPLYRVDRLDDVTVNIDAFDYHIENKNQIQLQSTIEIHGVSQEPDRKEESEPVTLDRMVDLPQSLELDETFSVDVKEDELEEEQPLQKDHKEKERLKLKQSQTLTEFLNKDPIKAKAKEITDEENVDQPSSAETKEVKKVENKKQEETIQQEPSLEEAQQTKEVSTSEEVQSQHDEERPQEKEDEGSASEASEGVDFLTHMFKDEEVTYTKMRLCIVQDRDTIETIADRYDLSPTQIKIQNKLEDEELLEGQLLYIPVHDE